MEHIEQQLLALQTQFEALKNETHEQIAGLIAKQEKMLSYMGQQHQKIKRLESQILNSNSNKRKTRM
jgi:hypothetical protein